MKINQNTQIIGKKVILIPYLKKHVTTYHEWMKKPELLDLTASEPLTLEEEYEMQRNWHKDHEKLTFLLVDKGTEDNYDLNNNEEPPTNDQILCGDVNLFIQPDFDDLGLNIAELEIMIAEKDSRRKGIALEALKIMLIYAIEKLNIELFVVHILSHNIVSKVLFEEKLGFQVEKFQDWSDEWILQKRVDQNLIESLKNELNYIVYKHVDWDGDKSEDEEDEEYESEEDN